MPATLLALLLAAGCVPYLDREAGRDVTVWVCPMPAEPVEPQPSQPVR